MPPGQPRCSGVLPPSLPGDISIEQFAQQISAISATGDSSKTKLRGRAMQAPTALAQARRGCARSRPCLRAIAPAPHRGQASVEGAMDSGRPGRGAERPGRQDDVCPIATSTAPAAGRQGPSGGGVGTCGGRGAAVDSDHAPTGAGRVRHGVEAAASARAPGGGYQRGGAAPRSPSSDHACARRSVVDKAAIQILVSLSTVQPWAPRRSSKRLREALVRLS